MKNQDINRIIVKNTKKKIVSYSRHLPHTFGFQSRAYFILLYLYFILFLILDKNQRVIRIVEIIQKY